MRLAGFGDEVNAEIARSDGYVLCEHRPMHPGVRPGDSPVIGSQCSGLAHFVLSWTGLISRERIHKPLCAQHGMHQVIASRDKRKAHEKEKV